LILLTAFLAGWELVFYNVSSMRIPGVLQRIAVCYLAASIIFLNTGLRSRVVITVVLLLAYWALMTLVPVPGCEVFGVDDKACNLAAWLDRTIIGQDHMWRSSRVFDPEGILSTIPAIATTLFGVLTGEWLMRGRQPKPDAENSASAQAEDEKYKTVSGLFLFGTILLAAGWSWSLIFPLNKSLWTSSYSVYTAGLALLTLGICFYLVEIKKFTRLAKPFRCQCPGSVCFFGNNGQGFGDYQSFG
jgi:predicted acyltransferase